MKTLLGSLVALGSLASATFAGAGTPGSGGIVPVLSHSAPELGELLTIRIDDALPGAAVGLALSPEAGSFAIPQGTVHLDPVGLVLFPGTADASGSAVFSAFVPMAALLAERELHFQAFVVDPGATAGGALSNSIHLRLVGSRLYIAVGGPPPGNNGLLVRSAVSDQDLFLVDAIGSGAPVFSADRALGAIATADNVRIFDNFFGGVVHVVPLPGLMKLARDAAGSGFFAFTTFGALHHIDFKTGATLGALTGLGIGGGFATNASATEGYVTFVPPALRRIDLALLADLGAVDLGTPADTNVGPPLPPAAGPVAAVTSHAAPGGADYTLNHVAFGATPPLALTPLGFYEAPTYDFAALEAGIYLRWQLPYCLPPGPAFSMLATPLDAAGSPAAVPPPPLPPPTGCVQLSAGAEAGPYAWMVDRCCQEPPGSHEPAVLWQLDLAALTWSSGAPLYGGQELVAVVDDAFASRVFVPKYGDFPPAFPATLYAVDASSLSVSELSYSLVAPQAVGATFHAEVVR